MKESGSIKPTSPAMVRSTLAGLGWRSLDTLPSASAGRSECSAEERPVVAKLNEQAADSMRCSSAKREFKDEPQKAARL